MYDLVFKNALMRDGRSSIAGDLAVDGEKIVAIGTGLAGRREIPVDGDWLLPGALDVHVHFSLPFAAAVSSDDYLTGTRAAAMSGVTTVIDFLSQQGDEGIKPGFERRMEMARGKAVVDYAFHACIGRFNAAVEADLPWAIENGMTSLKVFTAYRQAGLQLDDGKLFRVFRRCRELGILPTVHAENGDLIDTLMAEAAAKGTLGMAGHRHSRPAFTEVEAVQRVADIAGAAEAPVYIVHLSSGKSVERIAKARRKGVAIFAETCPQYLLLDDTTFDREDGHCFASCPPVRPPGHQEELWQGLVDGHLQVLATDHCPFPRAAKDTWGGDFRRIPMGIPGLGTLLPLMLDGFRTRGLDVDAAIRALTCNPAQFFGLYPRKGTLQPGADADLVIYSPSRPWTVSAKNHGMNVDYSPYEGRRLTGYPRMTLSRGVVVFDGETCVGQAGCGRYLNRGRPTLEPFLNKA